MEYARFMQRARALLDGRDHLVVHYETLAAHPAETLARIMRWLGFAYEPAQLDWQGREQHNFAGNRLRRRRGDAKIRVDTAWSRELSLVQKLGVSLITWPLLWWRPYVSSR